MLTEASDINDWMNQYIPSTTGNPMSRMKFRTASFCTERSGHFDAFDQGISFFLPNMTWLQPPGYVHKMIKDHYSSLTRKNKPLDYTPLQNAIFAFGTPDMLNFLIGRGAVVDDQCYEILEEHRRPASDGYLSVPAITVDLQRYIWNTLFGRTYTEQWYIGTKAILDNHKKEEGRWL